MHMYLGTEKGPRCMDCGQSIVFLDPTTTEETIEIAHCKDRSKWTTMWVSPPKFEPKRYSWGPTGANTEEVVREFERQPLANHIWTSSYGERVYIAYEGGDLRCMQRDRI